MNLNEMNIEQLTEHIAEAMTVLRRKAYGEGYKQGKFDAKMDGIIGKYGGGETAQEARDRIVEQAKKDVEEIKKRLGFEYVDFIVNRNKRTVVALLKDPIWNVVKDRGIAKAHSNDCFNVHIGKVIALRRALGLEVPDEYLNAPHPTEVRVGDIVEYNGYKVVICDEDDTRIMAYSRGTCRIGSYCANSGKIIDDSREDVTNK